MEENTVFKRVPPALVEMLCVGFGGSTSYPAPQPVEEPEPPPPPPAAPEEPVKSKAELELEQDLENKQALSASKRKGRKSTILTQGIRNDLATSSGGLLTYESMTGIQQKDKLGG